MEIGALSENGVNLATIIFSTFSFSFLSPHLGTNEAKEKDLGLGIYVFPG
jgi:hypothetical protein